MIEKQEVGVRAIATYSNGAKRDVSTMVNWFSNSSKVTVFGPALRANSDGDALISISGFGGQGASPIWVTVEEE